MNSNLLMMNDITKIYPNGTVANYKVNFSVVKGEIHALAGENGAGKSTLMKILYGLTPFDTGHILLNGDKITINNPIQAMKYGIGMVHQHFMLIEELTVAENIMLGFEPRKGVVIDYPKAINLVKELSLKYNMKIDPNQIVRNLTVAQKQKVEILKVLAREAKIIILDEPTAVLTAQEIEEFFNQLISLKSNGHTIIIITHKINEMKAICDRISILKLGKSMGTFEIDGLSEQEISRLMVGSDFNVDEYNHPQNDDDIVLDIGNLTLNNNLNDISFHVHKKEILGIVGVEGNGQNELIDVLTAKIKNYEGLVKINDKDIKKLNIKEIRKLGVGYIPEDRIKEGVNLEGSILDNLIGAVYAKNEYNNKGFIRQKNVRDYSKKLINEYGVKCNSYNEKINQLSGGNMQKVVCAREIDSSKELLIACQPTRGVDIGSMIAIHEEIIKLRDSGKAVLLFSSDINEVYQLCKRIIILYNGKIVANINDLSNMTEEDLGLYMLGLKDDYEVNRHE